jgi:hypothetical protein
MKWMKKNKTIVLALALFLAGSFAAPAQDSTKNELIVNLSYFISNNKIPYLLVNTKTKVDKKFQPVKGITVNLYLDEEMADNSISKAVTDETGTAKAVIPPALKTVWDEMATHSFIAVSEPTKEFDETKTEISVTKTKITIDTISGSETRSVLVSVSALEGNEWVPAKDVEMRIGVARSASILNVSDEETYTTDSTGIATAEFKKDSLPGDQQGNIVLVAKVEDNDQYGNFDVEKSVPWGVAIKQDNNFFDQRTLWSTRFRTPLWLLFMAYSIVIGVWGTIIYLIFQIVRIKKAGMSIKGQ